ncbi:uncharacterized protein F4812DRAFT_468585 [Daldinia caldariorum]|uniref:uncharacterized protein n=1 Tax=Daldinia caldariorum TaxID=326644 RepID=UPI002007330B|nr:uncharacterized protein F4812DRAFT_468585 [Daldinia caldariorum]KAI1463735.1 hypothetical protein F4812DRAFT_468585 [Daldinia caldariorum]
MTQLTISSQPGPGPVSTLSSKNDDKEIFYHFNLYPGAFSVEVPKKISFPNPPRPPTPGPPRPPPIPPRPPVPTPPPSPNSSAEMEWLQKILIENISALAIRVMNTWFALYGPVSFPHPPRPPTPGPRPGPIGPRPDVPTPPPSPRRSAESAGCDASQDGNNTETCGPSMTWLGQLFYECPDQKLNILYTPKSTSYDPCEGENLDVQEGKRKNKLTDDLSRYETRLQNLIYVPKSVSSLHMSHLNSYGADKTGRLGQALGC